MASAKRVLALTLVAAPLALASLAASATATTYTLPNYCNPNTSFKDNALVTVSGSNLLPGTCTISGVGSISAWSNTSNTGTSGTSTALLQSAYIGDYGSNGLGVTSTAGPTSAKTGTLATPDQTTTYVDTGNGYTTETTTSPNHAMDNQYNQESILLSYNTAVTLTGFSIGWSSTDSDMTVLRYTGGTAPNLSSQSYSTLVSSGWVVVGNYANVAVGSTQSTGLSPLASNVSSYWLIAAYNSVFGTTSANGGTLGDSNDFVKLLTVTTDVPAGGGRVPEPSSALLVGIAIAGLAASRKRFAPTR